MGAEPPTGPDGCLIAFLAALAWLTLVALFLILDFIHDNLFHGDLF